MKRVLAVTLTLGFYALALGQGILEISPHNKLTKPNTYAYIVENDYPVPPPMPVRTMAEWEEVQAVVLTWTDVPEVLTEIVRHAVTECQVFIVTNNENSVTNVLEEANISLDNISFINQLFDDIWIRDYGPWTVYQNDVDSLSIIDWRYNRLRPLDDLIPGAVANHMGVSHYEAILPPYQLFHAGGNHLQDGMGTLFTSDLIFDENIRLNEQEIDQIMDAFMGVEQDRYFKLPKLPFDIIHHLDMHMRLIDEETILIGEYPEGIADGPQIEDNIRYIKTQLRTPFGNPYRIVRLPMPPNEAGMYPNEGADYRTYSNALFVNKSILVPTYDSPFDSLALAIYQEELPGYNVVGINCNPIIPRVGAVHCITKLIGSNDPFWIAHARLRDTYAFNADYVVKARVKHKTGIERVTLFYRVVPDTLYSAIEMVPETEQEDGWIGLIPEQPVGSEIQYYIESIAYSGRTQVRPIVAPEGYFKFRVLDITVPEVELLFDLKETCPGQPVQFYDNSKGVVDTWEWSFPGAIPATSNMPQPTVVYPNPGTYPVTLTVSNNQGSSSITLENIISVAGGVAPFLEDFSNGINANWTIEDHQQDGTTWTLFDNGNCNGQCLYIDNWSVDTRNTNDYFRIKLDLSNFGAARLDFDVAYAAYDHLNHDALRVSIIRCNGARSTVYGKESFFLASVPPTTALFTPANCEQWRHESVDLCEFAGEVITLEFEHISRYDNFGNALYLDNIEVVDVCITSSSVEPESDLLVKVWPNPASEQVQFSLGAPLFSNLSEESPVHIVLLNESGQMVYHKEIRQKQHNIAVKHLPSGLYFWMIQTSKDWGKSGKIIIE